MEFFDGLLLVHDDYYIIKCIHLDENSFAKKIRDTKYYDDVLIIYGVEGGMIF